MNNVKTFIQRKQADDTKPTNLLREIGLPAYDTDLTLFDEAANPLLDIEFKHFNTTKINQFQLRCFTNRAGDIPAIVVVYQYYDFNGALMNQPGTVEEIASAYHSVIAVNDASKRILFKHLRDSRWFDDNQIVGPTTIPLKYRQYISLLSKLCGKKLMVSQEFFNPQMPSRQINTISLI